MDGPKIQAEGRLERAGSARYRDGSHALVPTGDRIVRFVLRSEAFRVTEFEGQLVRINGSVVGGQPPNEGGPQLLDVISITPLQQEEE